jgi:hypothetical protein
MTAKPARSPRRERRTGPSVGGSRGQVRDRVSVIDLTDPRGLVGLTAEVHTTTDYAPDPDLSPSSAKSRLPR